MKDAAEVFLMRCLIKKNPQTKSDQNLTSYKVDLPVHENAMSRNLDIKAKLSVM